MVSRAVTFLSGIPGAGKSSVRRRLVEEHGYFGVSLNAEDPPAPGRETEIRLAYGKAVEIGGPTTLLRLLRRGGAPAVVEWGFPINDRALNLTRAINLSDAVHFAWLECDNEQARTRWLAGTGAGRDPGLFDKQVAAIRARYSEIMEAISPQVVNVLTPDSSPRTVGDIAAEVLAG